MTIDPQEPERHEEWATYHSTTSMTFGAFDYAQQFGVLGTGTSWSVSDTDPETIRFLFNRQVWKWKRAKRRYRALARIMVRQSRPVHTGEWLEVIEDCAACLNTLIGMQWAESGYVSYNTVQLGERIFPEIRLSVYLNAAEYDSFQSIIDTYTELVRHPSRVRYFEARLERHDAHRAVVVTSRVWAWVLENSGLRVDDEELFAAPEY